MRGRVNRRDFIALFSSAATCRLPLAHRNRQKSRASATLAVTLTSGGHGGLQVFHHGLRDPGYVEGQTIALEVHWADSGGRNPCHLLAGDRGGSPEVGGGASASRGTRARGFRGGVRGCGAR